ncbi:hypothetical protein Tco_0550616 [Tanacetum coccineum]
MYQPPQTDDDDQILFLGAIYDEMDQATDSNKEAIADNILDEKDNLQAFADKPSDPLGHIRDEPSIIKEALQQSLPKFDQWIQEALKSTVPDLLSKPVQRPPMLDNFGKSKAKAVKEAKAKATEDAKANTEGGLSQLTPQVLKNLRLRLRMSNHLKHLYNLFQTTSSEYSLTPPSDDNKGKVIATKEEPMKQIKATNKLGD